MASTDSNTRNAVKKTGNISASDIPVFRSKIPKPTNQSILKNKMDQLKKTAVSNVVCSTPMHPLKRKLFNESNQVISPIRSNPSTDDVSSKHDSPNKKQKDDDRTCQAKSVNFNGIDNVDKQNFSQFPIIANLRILKLAVYESDSGDAIFFDTRTSKSKVKKTQRNKPATEDDNSKHKKIIAKKTTNYDNIFDMEEPATDIKKSVTDSESNDDDIIWISKTNNKKLHKKNDMTPKKVPTNKVLKNKNTKSNKMTTKSKNTKSIILKASSNSVTKVMIHNEMNSNGNDNALSIENNVDSGINSSVKESENDHPNNDYCEMISTKKQSVVEKPKVTNTKKKTKEKNNVKIAKKKNEIKQSLIDSPSKISQPNSSLQSRRSARERIPATQYWISKLNTNPKTSDNSSDTNAEITKNISKKKKNIGKLEFSDSDSSNSIPIEENQMVNNDPINISLRSEEQTEIFSQKINENTGIISNDTKRSTNHRNTIKETEIIKKVILKSSPIKSLENTEQNANRITGSQKKNEIISKKTETISKDIKLSTSSQTIVKETENSDLKYLPIKKESIKSNSIGKNEKTKNNNLESQCKVVDIIKGTRKSARKKTPANQFWILKPKSDTTTENVTEQEEIISAIEHKNISEIQKPNKKFLEPTTKKLILNKSPKLLKPDKLRKLTIEKIRKSLTIERRKSGFPIKTLRNAPKKVEKRENSDENYSTEEENGVPCDTILCNATLNQLVADRDADILSAGQKRKNQHDENENSSKKRKGSDYFMDKALAAQIFPSNHKGMATVCMDGQYVNMECFAQFPRVLTTPDTNSNLSIGLLIKNKNITAGIMEILPLGSKKYELTKRIELSFFILEGIAEVCIGESSKVLHIGDFFLVPRNTPYYILNVSSTNKLLLHFSRFAYVKE